MENGDGREWRCPCRRVGKSTIVAKGQPASSQIRQFTHMSSCCEGVSGSAILCKSADCFTAAATTSRRATLSQFSLTDSTRGVLGDGRVKDHNNTSSQPESFVETQSGRDNNASTTVWLAQNCYMTWGHCGVTHRIGSHCLHIVPLAALHTGMLPEMECTTSSSSQASHQSREATLMPIQRRGCLADGLLPERRACR